MAKRAQQARAVESQRLHFPALDELTRNSDASARLIARLRALNPDRSLDWCEEKAIYDIKRDSYGSINGLMRQLTGVKPGKVKAWMDENKAALDSYNSGYSRRQNVGKPDSKSVIKWSESAYGAYEW